NWRPCPLSTEGGLAFGAVGGFCFALDADSGRKVWQLFLGGNTAGAPISFSIDDGQVIGEILCADPPHLLPGFRVVTLRLPRVTTDQTSTVGARTQRPVRSTCSCPPIERWKGTEFVSGGLPGRGKGWRRCSAVHRAAK